MCVPAWVEQLAVLFIMVTTSLSLAPPVTSNNPDTPGVNSLNHTSLDATKQTFLSLPPELRDDVLSDVLADHQGNAPPALAQVNGQLRDEILAKFYSTHTFTFYIHDKGGDFYGNEPTHIAKAKRWAISIGDNNARLVRHLRAIMYMEPHIGLGGKMQSAAEVELSWEDGMMKIGKCMRVSGIYLDRTTAEGLDREFERIEKETRQVDSPSEQLAMWFDAFRGTCYWMS